MVRGGLKEEVVSNEGEFWRLNRIYIKEKGILTYTQEPVRFSL